MNLPKLAVPLALILAVFALTPPTAMAQRQGAERYDEPTRFPVLRKAFRQIRSDVRYHASALKDTASGIRHDVESTIRGDTGYRPPSQYGYRGETRPAPNYDRPQPRDGEDYYEEPRPPRREVERPSQDPPRRPPVDVAPPKRGKPELDPEPQIVAPRNTPAPTPIQKKDANPVVEKNESKPQPKTLPKPELKPEPKPQVDSGAKSKEDSKPVLGKVEYPYAKRSNRPGFHYSPYEPYELLDTQGIEPGELAKDPGNGKIFRLPK